jgi:quinohemoprotein ethanol dehydrogenase
MLPDLRRLTPEKHSVFYEIVLNGALRPLGMGRFDDVLTREDAQAIHAYLIDEAWDATAGLRNAVHRAAENTSTLATMTGDAFISTP